MEIITGGNIIMPIDMRALATTMSITIKGIKSIIPIDEVINTVNTIGKQLPESLRETSDGGLAVSETGIKISKKCSCVR